MDVSEIIEEKCGGRIFARCLPEGEEFDEARFLASRSFDEFIVEDPADLDEAAALVEQYDLPGEAAELPESGYYGGRYGVRYDGVNALQFYDDTMMGHGHIVIFEGDYLGNNMYQDGDVVRPEKILMIISSKANAYIL